MMKIICYGLKCPYFHKPPCYNQMLPMFQKHAMETMKSHFMWIARVISMHVSNKKCRHLNENFEN